MKATYSYDDADRLTEIKYIASNGTVLANYTYTFDNVENIVTFAEDGEGNQILFAYDRKWIPVGQFYISIIILLITPGRFMTFQFLLS